MWEQCSFCSTYSCIGGTGRGSDSVCPVVTHRCNRILVAHIPLIDLYVSRLPPHIKILYCSESESCFHPHTKTPDIYSPPPSPPSLLTQSLPLLTSPSTILSPSPRTPPQPHFQNPVSASASASNANATTRRSR